MANLPHSNSRRMYSWWWDSHISPKNSRWLKENLTDMDAKVKSMIKLIEEDADSFARRAEMYYKKRPELMKMVEEFYRAYRALAERYDQSTRALLQASKTMTEANFPNQVPSGLTEDELEKFAKDNDSQNDPFGSRIEGKFGREKVRKGLSFNEAQEKEDECKKNVVRLEKEIETLRGALAKFEAEKESNLAHYKRQQVELFTLQEADKKTKDEVEILKIALKELEVEKGTTLSEYQKCLEKIEDLEGIISCEKDGNIELNARAKKAEDQAQNLKINLLTMESEKGTVFDQSKQLLKKISYLENKLVFATEEATKLTKRAEKAETEMEILKEALSKFGLEKEANAVQYQQSLDTILALQKKISFFEEEVQMFKGELESGVAKLNCAEEKYILLENKLVISEKYAKVLKENVEEAATEAKILKETVAALGVERDVNAVQYQDCMDTISTLENKIFCVEEEVHMLNGEIESGIAKLKGAEEKCILLENKLVLVKEESNKLKERAEKTETEAEILKVDIGKLGVEKEANAVQYQKSLNTILTLEKKISCAEEEVKMLTGEIETGVVNLKGAEENCILLRNKLILAEEEAQKHNERAEKVEKEAEILKNDLAQLALEKEANAVQYQQCLDTISTLTKKISCAEEEAQMIHEELENGIAKLKGAEENCILLTNKLVLAEEEAQKHNGRAEKAEKEAEILKNNVAKLGLEKEANTVQYQQCLDTISTLTKKISCAEEEAQMLNEELENGIAKLKGAEEKCTLLEKTNQYLYSELKTLNLKIGVQSEEITEKDREMGILWSRVQDERFRFVEAETAFQTLQLLHAQTEENLKFLTLELQNRSLTISNLENRNQSLLNENKSLNELNSTSLLSIRDMQNEIIGLSEHKVKLEEEIEHRVDQRNALQQDIYCLKEELNDLNKKYLAVLDENVNLKEIREEEMREKTDLLGKVEELEKVVEKNFFLEKLILDSNASLEGVKAEIFLLERSFKSVSEEKSTLNLEKAAIVSQLQVANENLVELSETNAFMKNLVSDAHDEIEEMKMRLKSMKESFQILDKEKLELNNEKVTLVSEAEITRQIFKQLEIKYRELEEKYSDLEIEKESALCEIVELQLKINEIKQKVETQIIEMENLHGKIMGMEKTSFTLREEKSRLVEENQSLVKDCMYLQDKNNTLERENILILGETASLSILSVIFKNIIREKSLEIEEHLLTFDKFQTRFENKICAMGGKLEELEVENIHLKNLLKKTEDNLSTITLVNSGMNLEKSAMVKDFVNLQEKNKTLEGENLLILGETASLYNLSVIFKNIIEEKYLEIEELRSTVDEFQRVGVEFDSKISAMAGMLEGSQIEGTKFKNRLKETEDKLSDITLVNGQLNLENIKLLDERKNLVKDSAELQEKINNLEGENILILGETASLSNLAVVFKNIISEKSLEIEALQTTLVKMKCVSVKFEEKLGVTEGTLKQTQVEKRELNKLLKRTEDNLSAITLVIGQLNSEIENGNELLRQKETEICNAKSKVAKIETGNSELHCLVADLKEKNGDIEMYLETEATKLTSELYTTSVVRALLEEKFNKLVGVLKCIEEETNCKDKEIELLTKKISLLEGENGALGARLAEYAPAISSLKDCISSLENSTWLFEAGVENHVKSHEGSNADQKKMNDLLDLLDMETRVKVVMRQIEELGPKSASNQEKVMPVHVNSESENKILTKDIMLDEISESSSSGLGRKECMEAYLADLNGNGKLERPNEKEIAFASVEIVEKDFGLGDLTISKRFSLPNQELDKPKILERLNSDSQKLVNLQTIVQDLKMKVDMSEKRMEGKSSGRESIGDQLVKAEEDIMQLCDVNGILIKNVDDSDDVKSVVVSEEKRNLRRRFSEQARKVSERIGQLQLEVQKIQFIMLKMDGENAKDQIKRKSRNTGIKRRISLRDYFGIRNSNRKRKRSFCSCVHPPATAE